MIQTCGEALIQLLEKYGVDTIFGIPGVHTLELYRGMANSNVKHVLTRHEQGAGFMADGYARVTGKPGVMCVITGPGVTNATTPLGQSFADSIPVLMISSEAASDSLGKGWGVLHETTDQQAITQPLTAMSVTALRPSDLPELVAQAFTIFASQRPRPVHIAVPIDVLAMPVDEVWQVRQVPSRAEPNSAETQSAISLLKQAVRPIIMVGGGALGAGEAITAVAEKIGAGIICSNAAKGIIPHEHPLNYGTSIWRTQLQDALQQADVVLAVGTEMARTDSYIDRLPVTGKVIRVDLDARKINDIYPATVGIVADAKLTVQALVEGLGEHQVETEAVSAEIVATHKAAMQPASDIERQHILVLNAIRSALPSDGVLTSDMTQIGYSGAFAFPTSQPRTWHHPGGFCTLGCAVPMAIGAKLAQPHKAVAALAGDGGFMFTMPEIMVAIEQRIGLPIVIWNNNSLGQIKEDMITRDIPTLGVDTLNPDYALLAQSFGCAYALPDSLVGLEAAIVNAFSAETPTIIEVNQDADYLLG